MKAISLWQPWASAIALGYKTHETRHWSTHHRGMIAIHAAKRWTRDEREFVEQFQEEYPECPFPEDMPLGCVVAVAELTKVISTNSPDIKPLIDTDDSNYALGNYFPERFAWQLERVDKLSNPVPCKGRQGIFDLPQDVLVKVYEDLGRTF